MLSVTGLLLTHRLEGLPMMADLQQHCHTAGVRAHEVCLVDLALLKGDYPARDHSGHFAILDPFCICNNRCPLQGSRNSLSGQSFSVALACKSIPIGETRRWRGLAGGMRAGARCIFLP